jgi:hypothetical protein
MLIANELIKENPNIKIGEIKAINYRYGGRG